ncbi:hypothetical protein KA005_05100 [bacterium]|nr:hypothetical protein [bacterium]
MDLEKLFGLYVHNQESPDKNYQMGNVTLSPKDQVAVIHKSIQAFMHKTGTIKNEKIIQAFTGSSDLPVLTKDVFNVTNEVPNFDLNWQASFKGIQLMKGQLSWELGTVTSGASFKLIPEGEKVKYERFKGEKVSASVEKYAEALGISWETVEGRKLYAFIDQMEQTRAHLYNVWADVHYGLLAAAGALNTVAWSGVATDPQIDRDIATINQGYQELGDANKDKGYGDTANSQMLIYATPNMKARINQALRATDSDILRGRPVGAAGTKAGQTVEYNVMPLYSWNASLLANKALLVLPGNKIQNAVYLRELALNKQDIESLTELRTYWTVFGATIADTDQVYELSFA